MKKYVPYKRKQSIDSIMHYLDFVSSNEDFCQVIFTQQTWMPSVKVPLANYPVPSDAK